MRILLKLELDCDPDDAWRAIRSPEIFQEVLYPLSQFRSLEVGGFTERWEPGEHPVKVLMMGRFLVGQQVIRVSFDEDGTRIMRDTGRGLSGPLAVISQWDHSMAISASPDGKTLYRDQLTFSAGVLSPLLWPLYWAFWQWRASALKRLAPSWSRGSTQRTSVKF